MKNFDFNPQKYQKELSQIIRSIIDCKDFTLEFLDKILKKNPKDKNQIFSRDNLIAGIEYFLLNKDSFSLQEFECDILKATIDKIKLKPMRTASGVTTVTVLTKPFACPGKCVFCPNDVRMPKSYIANEPGAQRALMNRFSPFGQVYNRLRALKNIGHPTQKIELLVLGGTWSYYPKKYKIWFIHECFRAMNVFSLNQGESMLESSTDYKQIKNIDISSDLKIDFNDTLRKVHGNKPYNQLIQTKEFKNEFESKIIEESNVEWLDLFLQQEINSKGQCRCVGLVLETRPDCINPKEVLDLRKLGATKIQLGIQTLDNKISELNKRGEYKEQTANAFNLLRIAGFKIHAHIMPNLYGATPELDFRVYKDLFSDLNYKPDELKIYPTSIIKNTELYDLWKEGKYTPYSTQELVDLISNCMEVTPAYCRLTRIIRDIPSTEIEGGNKTTNLREVVEFKLKKEGRPNNNIRAREVKFKILNFNDLSLDIIEYKTLVSTEYFLQYITLQNQIAGFLRLSIPNNNVNAITEELSDCAIIREVHVYGPALDLSKDSQGQAQHLGLGSKLIQKAKEITLDKGFTKLAVISSIGTREYYSKRGFVLKEFYQIATLE